MVPKEPIDLAKTVEEVGALLSVAKQIVERNPDGPLLGYTHIVADALNVAMGMPSGVKNDLMVPTVSDFRGAFYRNKADSIPTETTENPDQTSESSTTKRM